MPEKSHLKKVLAQMGEKIQLQLNSLRESENKYRILTESIKDVVWILDTQTLYFLYVSPSVEKLRGYTPEEIMALPVDAALTPDAAEYLKNIIRERAEDLLSGRESPDKFYMNEVEQPCKDGSTVWTEVITSYYLNEKTGRIELRGVTRDITERRQAQEKLRISDERYRNAQKIAMIGSWEWNMLTDKVWWSDETYRIFGVTQEEFTPSFKENAGFIHPEDLEEYGKRFEYSIRTGNPLEFDLRLVLRDNTVKNCYAKASVLYDNSGKAALFVGTVMDITDRKKAELEIIKLNAELEGRVLERTALFEAANRQLESVNRQLEASNKELESFCYSVSHDLRSPLRGIDGWSLAIAEDYADSLDEQGQQYLEKIRGEAARMSRLIDDLLKLSRLTRSELWSKPVNLSGLAGTIAARLQEGEPDRRVEFVIQPDLIAEADGGMMDIVLTNLIGNTFKFTGKTALPRIEFGKAEPSIIEPDTKDDRKGNELEKGKQIFFVKDNGAGFDMKYAGKLFGAFSRLHKANEFPGTGIGLATVQRIIHKHGGRVWAESAVNQGATFYFSI